MGKKGFNYCQCCTEISFVNRVSHMLNLRFSFPNWTNISGPPQLISISWVPFILWVTMLPSMRVGFPSTCLLYQPHNLLKIWVWSLLSPPPPSHHHHPHSNSAAPGFCQKPAAELSACYLLLFLWGFNVPLVVVSSSRQKFWQRIMLNSTRDIFRLPPWRPRLWVGNGPWHSYTLCFSAGPHNSCCDLWCLPGELVFQGGAC